MSIYLRTEKIIPDWTDYNGHMNLAFYIHLFDQGWDVLLDRFQMGGDSAKNEKRTTFAVESHTTYDKELKVGDEVDIKLLFIDRDKKRIVYKLEMIHKQEQYLASTTEVCSLYVDLSERKVIEFESELISNGFRIDRSPAEYIGTDNVSVVTESSIVPVCLKNIVIFGSLSPVVASSL